MYLFFVLKTYAQVHVVAIISYKTTVFIHILGRKESELVAKTENLYIIDGSIVN